MAVGYWLFIIPQPWGGRWEKSNWASRASAHEARGCHNTYLSWNGI